MEDLHVLQSCSLTLTKTNYLNIEHEYLGTVWGIAQLYHYLYGKKFCLHQTRNTRGNQYKMLHEHITSFSMLYIQKHTIQHGSFLHPCQRHSNTWNTLGVSPSNDIKESFWSPVILSFLPQWEECSWVNSSWTPQKRYIYYMLKNQCTGLKLTKLKHPL